MTASMGLIALAGTGILAAAGLTTRLLRRASASLRHLVWTAALAALLVVPFLEMSGWRLEIPVPASLLVPPSSRAAGAEPATPADPVSTVETGVTIRDSSLTAWTIPGALAGAWGLGVLLFAAAVVRSHVAAYRLTVRDVQRPSAGVRRRFARLAAELGVRRPVQLVESARLRVPATWGFRRSTVVIPPGHRAWSRETLDRVLLHELAHVRRGDGWTHLLAQLARAVHWPNPLVWAALRCQRSESERACDDWVLSRRDRPTAYAEDLVDMVRAVRLGAGPPRAALAIAGRHGVEERIRALLDPNQVRDRVRRRTVVMTGALTAALAVTVTVVAPVGVAQAAVPERDIAHYTAPQADRGAGSFQTYCRECHSPSELSDDPFRQKWNGRSVRELYDMARPSLPDSVGGASGTEIAIDVTSYLLRLNGVAAGTTPLPSEPEDLERIPLDLPPL